MGISNKSIIFALLNHSASNRDAVRRKDNYLLILIYYTTMKVMKRFMASIVLIAIALLVSA